jgi:hypothetical protein
MEKEVILVLTSRWNSLADSISYTRRVHFRILKLTCPMSQYPSGLFFFFFGLWFELRALHHLSHTLSVHFFLVKLEMGISQTIYLGWPWNLILLISASHVVGSELSYLSTAVVYFFDSGDFYNIHWCTIIT